MTPAELLADAFTRIREGVERVVDGLDADQLLGYLDAVHQQTLA